MALGLCQVELFETYIKCREVVTIESLFGLFFGSLYDTIVLKIKRLRVRLILRKYATEPKWSSFTMQSSKYTTALLNDENLMNLFISREYRRGLLNSTEQRNKFISRLDSMVENKGLDRS